MCYGLLSLIGFARSTQVDSLGLETVWRRFLCVRRHGLHRPHLQEPQCIVVHAGSVAHKGALELGRPRNMGNLRSLCWSIGFKFILISFIVTAILPTAAFAGPVVQILQPQQGQTVTGVIWIDVSYSTSTEAPITTLEIFVDNELVRRSNLAAPETSGKKSFSWDFSFASATAHAISAKAIDSAGASGSASITVSVRHAESSGGGSGGSGDIIPPTVNIYYPSQGAKLAGLVEIRAEARDNVGVQQVYFYIDGRLHKMIYNSPPYYDQWDTSKLADGAHVLEAAAVDGADNEARSAQVTVIVENHAMTRMATPLTGMSTSPSAAAAAPQAATVVTPATVDSSPSTPATVAPPLVPPTTISSSTPVGPTTPAPAVVVKPATQPQAPKAASILTAPVETPASTLPKVTVNDFGAPRATAPAAATAAGNAHQGGLALAPTATSPSALPAVATAASRPLATRSASGTAITQTTVASAITSPRVTRPAYVQPVASTSHATPAGLPHLTSTAATLARADLLPSEQRVTTPQNISPLPATAGGVDAADAAVPTLAAITAVTPGGDAIAAPSMRTTSPRISALEAVAADAAPATSSASMLAMVPRTSAPALPAMGQITRPGIPDVAAGIAKSPVKDIAIVFDGNKLDLRAAPETVEGIATGPLRELFEQTDGVLYWFPITKEVRATNSDTDLHLTIGDPEIALNGTTERVNVAPYIKRGRTMLPLQFIADMLDLNICYEATTQQIVVTSNEF